MTDNDQLRAAVKALKERSRNYGADYDGNVCSPGEGYRDAIDDVLKLLAATPTPPGDAEQVTSGWKCFHCGEVFTDKRCARLHFGHDETVEPACTIKAGAEGSLLAALRRAEEAADDAIQAMQNESTDAAKAYHAQRTRHNHALIAAEELGYERGLEDGRGTIAPPAATVGPSPFERMTALDDEMGGPDCTAEDAIVAVAEARITSKGISQKRLISAEEGGESTGEEITRPCTCHPDDRPTGPCPKRYAASECRAATVEQEARELLDRLTGHATSLTELARYDAGKPSGLTIADAVSYGVLLQQAADCIAALSKPAPADDWAEKAAEALAQARDRFNQYADDHARRDPYTSAVAEKHRRNRDMAQMLGNILALRKPAAQGEG